MSEILRPRLPERSKTKSAARGVTGGGRGCAVVERLLAVVVGLGMAFAAPSGVAEERRAPFYEKNFAKNPLDGGAAPGRPRGVRAPDETPIGPTPSGTEEPPQRDALAERIDLLSSKEVVPPVELTALDKTHKVRSIGAILNALDKAHFQEKIRELGDVVARFDFDVGFIWAIGSFENLTTTEDVAPLVARNGVIELADRPPERYAHVERSPTWIVRTPDGDIILEGTGPLAHHFNVRGEFIEKGSVERVEVPAPASGAPTPGALTTNPTPVPTPTPDPLFGSARPPL